MSIYTLGNAHTLSRVCIYTMQKYVRRWSRLYNAGKKAATLRPAFKCNITAIHNLSGLDDDGKIGARATIVHSEYVSGCWGAIYSRNKAAPVLNILCARRKAGRPAGDFISLRCVTSRGAWAQSGRQCRALARTLPARDVAMHFLFASGFERRRDDNPLSRRTIIKSTGGHIATMLLRARVSEVARSKPRAARY